MTSDLYLIAVPFSAAGSWVRQSLEQGNGISAEALRCNVLDHGVYAALLPPILDARTLSFHEGGITSAAMANAGLEAVLGQLALVADVGLVVENDVMRRGDPALADLPFRTAYIEDRVIHWQQLSADGAAAAVALLRRGASGYPTNGFLMAAPALADLAADSQIDPQWCRHGAQSLVGILTVAFDGESYAIWLTESAARALGSHN